MGVFDKMNEPTFTMCLTHKECPEPYVESVTVKCIGCDSDMWLCKHIALSNHPPCICETCLLYLIRNVTGKAN